MFCRKLWQHVTESLRDGDIDKATEHKRALEERQRNEERLRAETETPWCTKYFLKEVSSQTADDEGGGRTTMKAGAFIVVWVHVLSE